jgi:hypothetical protein
MDTENAFEIINNLQVRGPLRKYQPQWSTIVISYDGNIVDVIKHKEQPSLKLNKEHLERYPDTLQITAWPGRFNSVADLERVVKESVKLGIKY